MDSNQSFAGFKTQCLRPDLAKPLYLLTHGGKYRIRTCGPIERPRLSKPLHYHSANLPENFPLSGSGAQSLRTIYALNPLGVLRFFFVGSSGRI